MQKYSTSARGQLSQPQLLAFFIQHTHTTQRIFIDDRPPATIDIDELEGAASLNQYGHIDTSLQWTAAHYVLSACMYLYGNIW